MKIICSSATIIIKGFTYVWTCFILIMIASCSKNETSPQEPEPIKIDAGAFSNLSANQVTLTAKVEALNNETILDHGFIWYRDKDSEETISLGQGLQTGEISHDIRPKNRFEQNVSYNYYLYVRTSKNFYKGPIRSFVLNNISFNALPILQSYGRDTLTLIGNFEGLNDDYRIKASGAFEVFTIPYELSSDKTSLTFVIGASPLTQANSVLDISLVRKDENPTNYQRQIAQIQYYAKLEPLAKSVYHLFGFIEFRTNDIAPLYDQDSRLTILINDVPIPYSRMIQLFRFPELTGNTFRIGYKNGKETVYFPDPIKLELPTDMNLRITRPVVHPHVEALFKAEKYSYYFFGLYTVTVGELETYVTGPGESGNMHVLPPQTEEGEYELSISNSFYSVTAPQKIQVKTFRWNKMDKDTGFFGEKVTAYGNFIEGVSYAIFNQNDRPIAYGVAKEGTLVFEINKQFEDVSTLKIGYLRGIFEPVIAAHTARFVSKGFTMDGFYPQRGTTGDILTITGKGIAFADEFLLGNHPITPIRFNNNNDMVTFSLPRIQETGKMRINYKMNSTWYQSEDLFELY